TDKGEWPTVEMGKISELRKGHWCLAIGHPNGYITGRAPVVRLGRILEINKGYLRTDCTLVGGDSGGPLFDMHGKVIGIHSRIGLPITANIHVPIDTYQETWDRLAKGEVWGDNLFGAGPKGKGGKGPKKENDEPFLGLRAKTDGNQCRVESVQTDSPAAKAGLKVGDVIIAVDGTKLAGAEDFDKLVRSKKPGDTLSLEVRRDEETLRLTVTLSKRPG
ncbi:MAG: S1C family serine protease, partial [Gemmataceae bacterium]|nr:S1C family serine protease [Gemmataceae bacterium]